MPTHTQINELLARARKLVKSQSIEALTLTDEARQLASSLGAHDLEAASLCLHASALLMLGRYDETMHTLQSATVLAADYSVGSQEGESLQLLGQAHFMRSRYVEAGECWGRCLMLPEAAINNTTRVRAHIGLGLVHLTHERVDMALEHHRMAEALALESDNPLLHSDAQLHVAADLIRLGQATDAMTILSDTLQQVRAVKSYEMEAEAYGLIGEIHLERGELDKAQAILMVALKINRLAVNLTGETANLISLGLCELRSNETASALEYFNYAHTLALESGSKRLLSRAEQALAQVYQALNDTEAAERHTTEYLRLRNEILHPLQSV